MEEVAAAEVVQEAVQVQLQLLGLALGLVLVLVLVLVRVWVLVLVQVPVPAPQAASRSQCGDHTSVVDMVEPVHASVCHLQLIGRRSPSQSSIHKTAFGREVFFQQDTSQAAIVASDEGLRELAGSEQEVDFGQGSQLSQLYHRRGKSER